MDSKKHVDGASSDEGESFESADEGDEGTANSNPPSATSAETANGDSTSKITADNEEDTFGKSQLKLDDNTSSETTQLEEEGVETVAQRSTDMDAQKGDIPCEDNNKVPSCTDEIQLETEVSNTIHAKKDGDHFSQNVGEDDAKESGEIKNETTQLLPEDDDRVEDRQLDESGGKLTNLGADELTDAEETQEHCQVTSEPSDDSLVEDVRPDSMAQKPAQEMQSTSGGWGWGGWTSMLSQATASVASGLSSVIETVETSLGVPDPQEIARKVKEEEKAVKQKREEEERNTKVTGDDKDAEVKNGANESFLSSFGVSNLTNVVQTTGKELVSGGLDALEFIGKKTMGVLAEGDPGLRQKRKTLAGSGPSLSQILKEAKDASETAAAEASGEEPRPVIDLFSEFDKFQGVAHLEALEMLSRDSEAELESRILDLTEDELAAVKPLLRAVEEVFHIDDDTDEDGTEGDDFKAELDENIKSLNLPFAADKLVATREKAREWIQSCVQEQDSSLGSREGLDIYSSAVSSLAELTARTVELFHKLTELLLHQGNQTVETSSLVRAQSARKMGDVVLEEISSLATQFAGCLNTAADDSPNPDFVSSLITTLYLDSSTSADYLRNSLKLLRPVMQLSSLNESGPS
ncbi:protein FAM114A2-like [Acropora millepora]|uniref:protein FAM114A2-like n=1 Tax=Acropora millepora TaxID=45264 RepID=UPI001CF46EB5|nr:protein FAM114A2-like [Acropora millepora]